MTELEKADVPMGVVSGKVNFVNIYSGYDFFKNYCQANNIDILLDDPDDKFIITSTISNLKVINESGVEIKGRGTNIESIDTDIFRITILGVPHPFYAEEFPMHIKIYNEMFKG